MNYLPRLVLTLILFAFNYNVTAQKQCVSDHYQQLLEQRLNRVETYDQFENWLKEKKSDSNLKRLVSTEETVYTIPVVFHIIHQGEAIGNGSNIPDGQIQSQLDIINQDFRRMNADASNTIPEFLSVAADPEIEFVYAKRDPEGIPTTGITRTQGLRNVYSTVEDEELKSLNYWPAEDYLNIWVVELNELQAGYAQFPISNLPGLNNDQDLCALTDGIVIDYRYFGQGFNALSPSLGRTGTHEIGHFLGLRHTFEGSCSSNDNCDDTPSQSSFTPFGQGCADLYASNSCGSLDMIQNFLDFSADECMNLFTICQKERMRTVLENSPRRKSLLTSKALEDPILVANDLGIRRILTPLSGECSATFVPQIEVRNYGTNTIESFRISLSVNGTEVEEIVRNSVISELSTSIVSFSEITIPNTGLADFSFSINETNEVNDGNSENNSSSIVVHIPEERVLPYIQDFETNADDWQTLNLDGSSPLWSIGQAPYETLDNQGFILNYFQSPGERFGETDALLSPVFDLSSVPSADISFKYAYAELPDNFTDALIVAVSLDCGQTFLKENYIFDEFSPKLATAGLSSTQFIPAGPSDWVEEEINITQYVGNSNVVIAFFGNNGGGNTLFLDDFELKSVTTLDYDLDLRSITNVPPVTCSGRIFPVLEVKNLGINTLTSFDLTSAIDGITQIENFSNISVLPGQTTTIRPDIDQLSVGGHAMRFTLSNPNGNTDQNSDNDTQFLNLTVNDSEDTNPILETFEETELNSAWSVIRPDGAHNWALVNAPNDDPSNQAIMVDGFNQEQLGIENWLVGPSLDLTVSDNASLVFRLSYANVPARDDRLKILLSVNCGQTYTETIYEKRGADLAVKSQATEWFPQNEEDWITEFVDLSEWANWSEVRLAFVVTNQNGNNLFLDDIELFTTAEPNQLDIENDMARVYPNPAQSSINIKFDLNQKADLSVRLLDLMGREIFSGSYPNTLNQNYILNNLNVRDGIYLLHIQGGSFDFSKRILIQN